VIFQLLSAIVNGKIKSHLETSFSEETEAFEKSVKE
jgi:hypothetical protein